MSRPKSPGFPLVFEVYQDRGGGYRWRLWARNGRIIGVSGEAFVRQKAAVRSADNLRHLIVSGGARASIVET
jgi:uncharacterized protein YegP (UPF0339 family)